MRKEILFIVSIIILIDGCSLPIKTSATGTSDINHSDFGKEFNTAHGFTVVLAENWTEVPKDFIDKFRYFSKSIAEQTGFPELSWDYGYQLSTSRSMLQYPFVLIRVEETGKVSESSLKDKLISEELETRLKEGLRKAKNTPKVCKISAAGIENFFYDPDNHILFTKAKMNIQDVGTVVGLSAIRLTERGSIQLTGYALEADIYTEFYKNAAREIKLSKPLIYEAEIADSDTAPIPEIEWEKVWFDGMSTPVIVRNLIHYRLRGYDSAAKSDIRRAYKVARTLCSKSPGNVLNMNLLKKYGFKASKDVHLKISGSCNDFGIGAMHVRGKTAFTTDETGQIKEEKIKNLIKTIGEALKKKP
ncbi:MAG: hypothetical protein GY749_46140 [Desulfobacteraceae bacterium]|nr:hypothetical protein [Desulfobacteraceae bacterium]